jgi:multicomponent Na+:H+ antiporter subunit D
MTMNAEGLLLLPPGVALMALAALAAPMRAGAREALLLAAPLAVLGLVWLVPDGPQVTLSFLDHGLVPLQGGSAGRLFATIFAIMTFAGTLYGLRQASPVELVAAQVCAGSAIGVCLSGDLITLIVYWEIMALASTVVLWSARSEGARQASQRYIAIHLLGGVLLMAGIAGHVAETGSVAFSALPLDGLARWLILAGFLLNAGAPPLSAWIPDAYPEASPSGSVFLSAFTTKTAVFVLWVAFPGEPVLIALGLYMIFYGILYALLENDMRRILAYSIVNQVGFMVAGIGIGTQMALNGAAAHAFTHILYKALLLMSAGAVLAATGRRKCTELGGLFQSMPLTTACGIVGALAISAFPLTSGFVSKSMISQAAADQALAAVWFLLAAASAGVFLHAGIKFPWFVFFQKDCGLRPPDPPRNMQAAMVLCAFLCIAIGVYPAPLYGLLPFPVDYVPYTADHVVTQLQLLLFAGLAFFVLLPQMERTRTVTLDTDWFYRRAGFALATATIGWLASLRAAARAQLANIWQRSLIGRLVRNDLTDPAALRTSLGRFVLLTTLMLLSYLALNLL